MNVSVNSTSLRALGSYIAIVMAVLTQAFQTIHLPPWASVVLGVFGAVERYLTDPSTGNPAPTPARPIITPAPPAPPHNPA